MTNKSFNAHSTNYNTFNEANNEIFDGQFRELELPNKTSKYIILYAEYQKEDGGRVMPLGSPIATVKYHLNGDLATIDSITIMPFDEKELNDIGHLLNVLSQYFISKDGILRYQIKNDKVSSEIILLNDESIKASKDIVEKYVDIRELRSDTVY